MAAGEGGAEPVPPPSPSPAGPLPGPERALEEAAVSGSLSLAGRRLRHFPGGAARRWDLSDTTQADLSRNRFAEVPEDACQLMSLEGLSLYHNCLRSVPPTIANLQALTYLNVGRNQLASLPSCLCRLPLRVLIASNNKLASLPEDIGCLRHLRQLDVGSNELQSLPASVGGLESLRDLSVRKNHMGRLPEELAELPLVRLDFSCNRVTRIPLCFRHLRHLQCILLENNPLQSPPAQVCLKGKIHIFKYLHMEACSKARSALAEFGPGSRPPSGSGTCLPEDFFPVRQYGGLDSGFNSVDSGSKRWSGNESTDECLDLSLRIAELSRDPRQLKERRSAAVDGSDSEQVDFIDSSVNGEEEEEILAVPAGGPESSPQGVVPTEKARKSPLQKAGAAAAEHDLTGRASSRASLARPEPSGEERRRPPQTLQLWQERERQQQQPPLWSQGGVDRRESGLAETSSSTRGSQLQRRSQGAEQQVGSPRQTPQQADAARAQSFAVASCSPRESSAAQRPSSFLFRSSSRTGSSRGSASVSPELSSSPLRFCPGSPALDESELSDWLRQAIQSELKMTLADDLGEALANGVILCHLMNHLRPRSVPFIHVPSPAVPKLNAVRSRKNVESFLTACRQLGLPEVCLCSASDILLQGNARGLLRLLEALLQPPTVAASAGAGRSFAPTSLSEHLAGFGVFYVSVMLLLYLVYHKLCGF